MLAVAETGSPPYSRGSGSSSRTWTIRAAGCLRVALLTSASRPMKPPGLSQAT